DDHDVRVLALFSQFEIARALGGQAALQKGAVALGQSVWEHDEVLMGWGRMARSPSPRCRATGTGHDRPITIRLFYRMPSAGSGLAEVCSRHAWAARRRPSGSAHQAG